jgi:hypothetical protein
MGEENQTEIIMGLSSEERDDLEKMIKTFRKDQSVRPSISSIEKIQKQVESISENLTRFGDMLLKLDEKMKSYNKIIHLYFKKDEILNRRIDDIVKILKGQKNS